jgi:hypothetical protein
MPNLNQVPPAEYYQATGDNNQNIIFTKIGNLTIYSNARINVTTNLFSSSTNVTFLTRGDPGHYDFANITIPRNAIPHGITPKVFFANQPAEDQGYAQDVDNYYVWCTTHFESFFYGESNIVFSSPGSISTAITIALIIIVVIIVSAIFAWALVRRRL